MKVICINDSDRPNEIPVSKWVVKDKIYTIDKVMRMNMQNGLLGFSLKEIDLSGCFPYLYFSANRFRPAVSIDDINLEEMIENSKEELEIMEVTNG